MRDRRRLALPILALLAGLLGTFVAALQTSRVEEARRETRFAALADGAAAAIESRMLAQLTLLRGTAGFFNASDLVRREDFRTFVERLRLEQNYPGVLGIGYAAYRPSLTELEAVAAQARADGLPGFRPWPEQARPGGYSTILFLEPMNRLNQAALGFDMLSEPTRRAAMEASAREGAAVTSGRVRLVQEIDPVKQPGFLIYLPIYEEAPNSTAEGARGALRGWVYSPLRAYDLFQTVFAEQEMDAIVVQIFDESEERSQLLFESGAAAGSPAHVALRTVETAGRTWLVKVSSTPAFEGQDIIGAATFIAIGGVLISLLVAALMLQQALAALRTEREVEARTAELRAANTRILSEAQAREEAEAQLRQMQKMDAIGQLTGGIAHDFNNMLAVVIGNLDIAGRRIDQPERLQRALANAMDGARRAAELTQRLLAFARRQSLAPRALDANALVAGMSELLQRALGETVRLATRLADGLWTVHADPVQLENAILNIALNGRDAMPEGGTLTITTANLYLEQEDRERKHAIAPGRYVVISIRDTGVGMEEEVAAKALEPFFTTKEVGRGTGLGLSQVYGFVKQSGGHLRLHSQPGAGTRVDIYLPRHAGPAEAPDEESAQSFAVPRGSPGDVILVVEDEEKVRAMAVETLRDLGYTVLETASSVEALRLLEANPDIGLLFTDVVMPDLNGRQLAAEARRRRPDLRIVFTTGYTPDAILEGARLGDAAPLVQKPFTAAQLAQTIREALDRERVR